MNKEISTPRIEEMAKDFCKNTPRMKQEGGVTFYNRLVVALTEAHQAGIDKAVETINELKKFDPTLRVKVVKSLSEASEAGRIVGYNQALDDIIKALHYNK